jgi:hypothetical protein
VAAFAAAGALHFGTGLEPLWPLAWLAPLLAAAVILGRLAMKRTWPG